MLQKHINNKHKPSEKEVKSKCFKTQDDNKDALEETVQDVNLDVFKCPKCEGEKI